MRHITTFNTAKHHIYLKPTLIDGNGVPQFFRAILDSGAPKSEFSDRFLHAVKILHEEEMLSVPVPEGLQTRKYTSVVIPHIECLGQTLKNISVIVSKFEEHWGIDALIGLDFFRQFEVAINYKKGQIITEPLELTI